MLEPDPGLVDSLGKELEAGLARALDAAEDLARRWRISLVRPLVGATCSLVFCGTDASGREVVLKVPVIGEEATSGHDAALAFSGLGGVEVWEHDEPSGSLLMPRLSPGTDLHASGRPDLDALEVAANSIRKLRAASAGRDWSDPERYIPLRRWFQELFDSDAAAFEGQMGRVQELADRLLDTSSEVSLIHGDLHHFNLLQHRGRWVAIDPKGVVGDPAFEIVAFMRNPIPELADWPDLVRVQKRRLERLGSCLGLPVERLWGWSYVGTFLSAVWSGEGPRARWRDVSEALRELGERRRWL